MLGRQEGKQVRPWWGALSQTGEEGEASLAGSFGV